MKQPLTPRQYQIALTASGLAAALVTIRFLLVPAISAIGRQQATLRELRAKAADAAVLIPQQAQLEERRQHAQQRRDVLEARVRDQSVARILDTLGQEAKAHHLELSVVQEAVLADAGRVVQFGPDLIVREVPLRLQLRGRYRQVGEFLGALRAAPFLAAVRQAEIAKSTEPSGPLITESQLVVYLADRVKP